MAIYQARQSPADGGGDSTTTVTGPRPAQIEIHVVEDHPLYRAALVQVLDEGKEMRVGLTARSVEQFATLRRSPRGGPAQRQPTRSVLVLDLKLPGVSGAAAVAAVVGMGLTVLVLSASGARSDVLTAMAAGASGYLTKDADIDEIRRAVRQVAAGNRYVSPTLAAYLLDSARTRYSPVQLALSNRERQVLALLADGGRDQDIADRLSISVRTVRSHLDRIREKTGRRRRPELTRLAIEKSIVVGAEELTS
jgi:DNA-binding NarL/FixJ family response regulator